MSTFTSAFRLKDLQRGQALIFTLVFTAAAGLVGLLLFNSGMLANSKTRLQNAADAAAYSAGVLQARDQNFSAYTNRAMVANQAAVAQIVSLKSFVEDAADTGNRMSGALLSYQRGLWPSYAPAWDWTLNATNPIVQSINAGFVNGGGASGMVKYIDGLIKILEKAQQAHHLASMLDMVAVADEVVKANDPSAKLSGGIFAAGNMATKISAWSGSMLQHSANNNSAEADRFADIVVNKNTTDGFTRNRYSSPFPRWSEPVKPGMCLGAFFTWTDFSFTHAGGTILSSDKKSWMALDATEGDGYSICLWTCKFGVCPKYWSLNDPGGGSGGGLAGAGGYGETTGYKSNPNPDTLNYGWALAIVPVPAWKRYNSGPGSNLDSNGGIQDHYRGMTDPTGNVPNNQSPEKNGGAYPITIEIQRYAGTIRTSSKFLENSALIKLDDQLASNMMRSMASAHSYFYRSNTDSGFNGGGWRRGDKKTEIQNLFSPYWQARLVAVTEAERSSAMGEQAK